MKKGFTLIELLAVIIVLGIVALIAVPSILKIINGAQIDANSQTVAGLVTSAKHYYELYPEFIPTYEDTQTGIVKNSITKLLGAKIIDSIQDGTCGYFYVTYPNAKDQTNYKVNVGYIVVEGSTYTTYCSDISDTANCVAGTKNVGATNPCASY
jgi:type IV pilus assembly protein PilA